MPAKKVQKPGKRLRLTCDRGNEWLDLLHAREQSIFFGINLSEPGISLLLKRTLTNIFGNSGFC